MIFKHLDIKDIDCVRGNLHITKFFKSVDSEVSFAGVLARCINPDNPPYIIIHFNQRWKDVDIKYNKNILKSLVDNYQTDKHVYINPYFISMLSFLKDVDIIEELVYFFLYTYRNNMDSIEVLNFFECPANFKKKKDVIIRKLKIDMLMDTEDIN